VRALSAAYAAASERKRPGEEVHVLFAECTTADAGYDAERLNHEFAGSIEAEGTLLDEIPERLERFHYDLVATTTFHADEAQALVGGRVPVVAIKSYFGTIGAGSGAFTVAARFPSLRGEAPGTTTPEELLAFKHGGILPYVVRQLVGRS
jgi:hypothetical protein